MYFDDALRCDSFNTEFCNFDGCSDERNFEGNQTYQNFTYNEDGKFVSVDYLEGGTCCSTTSAYRRNTCKTGQGGDWSVGVETDSVDSDGVLAACPVAKSVYYATSSSGNTGGDQGTVRSVKVRVQALKAGTNTMTLHMMLMEFGDNGPATCITPMAVGGTCSDPTSAPTAAPTTTAAQTDAPTSAVAVAAAPTAADLFSGAAMSGPSLGVALLFAVVVMN